MGFKKKQMRTCHWCSKQFAREGNYDNHRLLCSFRHTKKASFDDLQQLVVAHLVERVEKQDAELVVLRRATKKRLSAEEWLTENYPGSQFEGILIQDFEKLLNLDRPFEVCLEAVLPDQDGFVVVKNTPYCFETEWTKIVYDL